MLEIQNTKLQTHVEYMTKTCSPTHRPNAHGETEYEFATQMNGMLNLFFVHRKRKAMKHLQKMVPAHNAVPCCDPTQYCWEL